MRAAVQVVIRPARVDELIAVGTLTADAYARTGAVGANDRYAALLRDAADRAERAELYVATDGDILLGTVTVAEAGTPYAEVARPGELEFRMLAVDPAAHRRGVGRALVKFVSEQARRRGLVRLVLSVIVGNRPAEQLYERLGFARAPERDWEPVPGVLLQVFTLNL